MERELFPFGAGIKMRPLIRIISILLDIDSGFWFAWGILGIRPVGGVAKVAALSGGSLDDP